MYVYVSRACMCCKNLFMAFEIESESILKLAYNLKSSKIFYYKATYSFFYYVLSLGSSDR